MVDREFDSILEDSLSRIASGRVDVQDCLAEHPAVATELGPMLQVAESLRALPKLSLLPDAKEGIEARLLEAAAANPRLVPARRRQVWASPRWRLAFSGLAIVLILMFLTTGVVSAGAGALPGSILYPVKLATEEAWLWLAPARDEPRLHLLFAQRRLHEFEALLQRGEVEPALLEVMNAHLETALTGIEALPSALAVPLLEQVVQLTDRQQQVLNPVLDQVPVALRARLNIVLQVGQRQADRALEIFILVTGSQEMGGTPTLMPLGHTRTPGLTAGTQTPGLPAGTEGPSLLAHTATPEPVGQTVTTQELEPTATPEPPAPTETSGPGEKPSPTDSPASTPLPRPPQPTDTPKPPEPTDTPKPPEPTDTPKPPEPTKETPPGQTKTPQPPGQTPKPTKTPKPKKLP